MILDSSSSVDLSLAMSVLKSLDVDTLLEDVLVVLKWIVRWVEVLVWWTMGLLERSVVHSLRKVSFHLSSEVPLREKPVRWNPVVVLCWLVVPQVLEASSVGVRQVEWHVRESIIDSVALRARQELLDIVLDNWALSVGCVLGSSCLSLDAVSEGEDVLESGVLQSVWVHVHQPTVVGDAAVQQGLVWHRRWVDAGGEEWLLHDASIVNVLEGSNLLSVLVLSNLEHFPAEADIDASLVALVEGDLVGIAELVDLLVWSKVLDSGTGRGSTLELILSQERFVVKSIEVRSLTLVWEFGRIADHISSGVVPSVVVVSIHSKLVVEHVHENSLLLWGLIELWKSLDKVVSVIESWGKDKSLVGVLSAVGKNNLVLSWKILHNLGSDIGSGPWLHLGGNGSGLKLQRSDVLVANTEIGLRKNEFSLVRNESHLVLLSITLDEFGKGGGISSSYMKVQTTLD